MTTNPQDIAAIAEGLSDAQRRALLGEESFGEAVWRLMGLGLVTYWGLTAKGRAVRTALNTDKENGNG